MTTAAVWRPATQLDDGTWETPGQLTPQLAACEKCGGARQVTLAADPGVLWPCPVCCCHICGQPTDTAPECADCSVDEETAAKRRDDR